MKKYTDFLHNQNRFSLMKKISVFILFCGAILRGPQVSAQVCDSIPFTLDYVSCNGATAPLTISYTNTGINYTFSLDSVVSATSSWQNVRPGSHTIRYTGSNGCVSRPYFRALSTSFPQLFNAQLQPRANCSDTIGNYLLSAYGGKSPYSFKINGGATLPSYIVPLLQGRNTIRITDALGCFRDTIYTTILPPFDSVRTRFTFVPNSICDSVGTLTISAIDGNLPRPFSISINGQPYVNDSVLRNMRVDYGITPFLLKTPNGCVYNGRITNFQLYGSSPPEYRINYSTCGSPAPLSITYTIVNGVTYAFRLDGVASSNNTWQNVSPGRHTLGYTSSVGCSRADSTPFVLGTSSNMFVNAYELSQQQRGCVDTTRFFQLFVYNGQQPFSFSINDGPLVATPLVPLRNGLNYVTVIDANGCQLSNYPVVTQFRPDSVATRQTFVPNTNCDSIGTLTISVTDPRLQGPLSISFDGVTFTTDSVFRNVNIYGFSPIFIRTAQGCLYKITRLNYPRTNQKLSFYYNYTSYCNESATLNVVVYNNPSGAPYLLLLDGVPSTTNIWQNIAPGRHIISYAGSSCGNIDTAINLITYNRLSVNTEQQPLRSCTDTLYSFKLKVLGGRPPYTYKVDNGAPTTDSIFFLREGVHFVSVADAGSCRADSVNIFAYYRRDSVRSQTTFTPNTACDSLGTLTISVNDARITRPFTISVNGRPFTSDTIFRNIANYGTLSYVVRSAQGCLHYGYTPYYSPRFPQIYADDSSCANRLGRGNIISHGYSPTNSPLSYRWSNGSTSPVLVDVPVGIYTVTVTDGNGCSARQSVNFTTCVWAGDTDTSGVVNAADLLNIGLAFGERGHSRPFYRDDSIYGSNNVTYWIGQNMSHWSKQTPTNVNYKHIDADGNGIINHKDTSAIKLNWSKTRNVRGNDNPLEVRGAAPPIFVQTGRVVEGQWASFPIMLGDGTNAANGIYGLAFSINYDASVIDASTVYLTYNQNWLGNGDNVVRISKNFNGSIEAAVSRINQQNASGNGQIATLNFKMKTGTMGRNLAFSIDNQQVINKDAQTIPVVPTPTSTSILSSTAEPDWARQIEVFPNPTTGNVNIEGQNLDIKSVEVFDISGKSLFKSENVGKKGPLSIEHAGTYFLKILTEKGVIMRKVVKI
jgi:hypothetical protein